jgi:hypothetical protein
MNIVGGEVMLVLGYDVVRGGVIPALEYNVVGGEAEKIIGSGYEMGLVAVTNLNIRVRVSPGKQWKGKRDRERRNRTDERSLKVYKP